MLLRASRYPLSIFTYNESWCALQVGYFLVTLLNQVFYGFFGAYKVVYNHLDWYSGCCTSGRKTRQAPPGDDGFYMWSKFWFRDTEMKHSVHPAIKRAFISVFRARRTHSTGRESQNTPPGIPSSIPLITVEKKKWTNSGIITLLYWFSDAG